MYHIIYTLCLCFLKYIGVFCRYEIGLKINANNEVPPTKKKQNNFLNSY